jgi:transcriptional regulator with XRE-family HTH domain
VNESSFAARLDELFKNTLINGREATYEEVVRGVKKVGGSISSPYVWQLRKGIRKTPALHHVQSLSDYFGVPITYFTAGDGQRVAARVRRLFTMVHPAARGPYTADEVADSLTQLGKVVDEQAMTAILAGGQGMLSEDDLAAIAEFFQVKVDYFTDDEYAAQIDSDLGFLTKIRDSRVERIASRALALSDESRAFLEAVLDQLAAKDSAHQPENRTGQQ